MVGTLEERRRFYDTAYPKWVERTVYGCFENAAGKYGQDVFFISGGTAYTYRQTLETADRYASALTRAGVRAGDRVGVLTTNCPQFIFLTFSLAKLGAVKVPLSYKVTGRELSFYMNKSQLKYLFSSYPLDAGVLSSCPSLIESYVIPDDPDAPESGPWNELIRAPFLETKDFGDPHAVCDIMFTSGSTGYPKGALHTHDVMLRSSFANCYTRAYEERRRLYIGLPLFHGFAYWNGLLSVPFCGGSLVLDQKFNAGSALRLTERYKINDILGVPYMIASLLKCPEVGQFDISSLHSIDCSGAISPSWVWQSIRDTLHVADATNAFGGTELAGSSVNTEPTDPPEIPMTRVGRIKHAGSAGFPEFGGNLLEYKVVSLDDPASLAPPMVPGELCSRGNMFKGYFNDAEATGKAIDQDGYYHSGDIGCFDENGYIILKGRINDSYKINGELVCPQFLDLQIGVCPQIRAVEVVGVPDPRLQSVGAAFIELKEPCADNEDKVLAWCQDNIAKFQVPQFYIFEDAGLWPRTPSGKVQKHLLRDRAIQILQHEPERVLRRKHE